MSGDQQRKTRSFWPNIDDEYDPVLKDLATRHLEMTAFLRACLRKYHANPARMLRLLAPHWPEPRPEGNPNFRRRSAGGDDAA